MRRLHYNHTSQSPGIADHQTDPVGGEPHNADLSQPGHIADQFW